MTRVESWGRVAPAEREGTLKWCRYRAKGVVREVMVEPRTRLDVVARGDLGVEVSPPPKPYV